jgi:hypothetical protein
MEMTKTLTALAAAGTIALVSVATPSDALAQRRGHSGAVAAGVIGGLAAGAIIGSALAPRPYYYYEPAPVYVAPPRPQACVEQQWVWSERRDDYVLRNVRVPC